MVSRWLGHSSVAITQAIYQHVAPSMIAAAGDRSTSSFHPASSQGIAMTPQAIALLRADLGEALVDAGFTLHECGGWVPTGGV